MKFIKNLLNRKSRAQLMQEIQVRDQIINDKIAHIRACHSDISSLGKSNYALRGQGFKLAAQLEKAGVTIASKSEELRQAISDHAKTSEELQRVVASLKAAEYNSASYFKMYTELAAIIRKPFDPENPRRTNAIDEAKELALLRYGYKPVGEYRSHNSRTGFALVKISADEILSGAILYTRNI